MHVRNMKNKSVSAHDFAMIPRADIPRSAFKMEKALKTAFSFSFLIPIMCEEVLPGDTWKCRATIVARTAVPIVPVMDNWHLETFYFFVPARLTWANWQKFMGEQDNPGDSIAFTIPTATSPVGGYAVSSLQDYFGLPTVGQLGGAATFTHNNLPIRAYNQIWNQWFRDENLQNSVIDNRLDGPDNPANYVLLRRGKRHDYFTSALPFTQKGTSVSLPLGTSATIRTSSTTLVNAINQTPIRFKEAVTGLEPGANLTAGLRSVTGDLTSTATAPGALGNNYYPANLYADLTTATSATINQLRQSFQIQRLLERDARGGSRYTEIVRSHFGVVSPDARLQRPEYLGGGHVPIETSAIPQTSATGLTGGTTPAGNLAATGSAQGSNGFTYAATEHGYIIGLCSARADITYHQGVRKLWKRSTRYDIYWPVFAMLGEQPIYNYEIFADGSANDNLVFGYQERWAEYRYNPSQITGLMKPTSAGNISYWHSSQQFGALPTLNATFIQDDSVSTLVRNFAGGGATANQQVIMDSVFDFHVARPMPMYSVPGLVDHF